MASNPPSSAADHASCDAPCSRDSLGVRPFRFGRTLVGKSIADSEACRSPPLPLGVAIEPVYDAVEGLVRPGR